MTRYRTNEVHRGLKFTMKGQPCIAFDVEFNKPGKGQGTLWVGYRNLKTGRNGECVLAPKDTLEAADIVETEMTCERRDRTRWHFHDPNSGERFAVAIEAMRDAVTWIKGGETCVVTPWNGEPLVVAAPAFVTLRVDQTDPGLRGNTAGAAIKPATLETGIVVRVPLFIERGDRIEVDTRSGEYVKRI